MNKSVAEASEKAHGFAAGWGNEDLRHLSAETFAKIGMPNIVYIRAVRAGELADELGEDFTGIIDVPAETVLYAVHAANGDRMAVLDDRDAAFAGARQYELEPVSAH
jgi:hypothetical protein